MMRGVVVVVAAAAVVELFTIKFVQIDFASTKKPETLSYACKAVTCEMQFTISKQYVSPVAITYILIALQTLKFSAW